MSGTNPVATYAILNNTVDTASTYKANIDGNSMAGQRVIDIFAACEQQTANMTVTVDPGHVLAGVTLTEVGTFCQLTTNSTTSATVDDVTGITTGMVIVAAGVPNNTTVSAISGTSITLSAAATASATVAAKFQQVTGTITAPSGNPRIDRIVGDRLTGIISVVTGTPAATPTPPAIPSGKFPIAKVLLQTSSTSITNAMIYDERTTEAVGRGTAGELNLGAWVKNDGSNNLTLKTNATLFDDGSGNLTTGMTTEATLASATTTDLGTATSNIIKITGTTTINSFGSSASTADPIYILRFTGALTLTYNATSMILPGGASITTAAGDMAIAKNEGSGNWRVIEYFPAGTSLAATSGNKFLASSSNGASGPLAARAIASGDLPAATSGAPGAVQPDNTTITVSGGVITANYALMTALGVGSIIMAMNNSTTASAGSTKSASNLTPVVFNEPVSTFGWASSGDTLSGTWKALQTISGSGNTMGLWQRIA